MNAIIVIPARMASTRLPGKPLADIAGEAMIVRVWRQAMKAGIGPVLVAAADEVIVAAVERAGGRAVLTDPDLASGSDRVHEALERDDPERRFDAVINLQGDLPALDPAAVRIVAATLRESGADIATLAAPILDPADCDNPHVVKPVVAWNPQGTRGRALYFTRARAPSGEGVLFHHVGIYAFTRHALARFVALPPSALERRERLEQLRALEAGMRIEVAYIDAVPLSVDTPEDLERAEDCFHDQISRMTGISLIDKARRVVFQGEPGSYSHLAALEALPHCEAVAAPTFEDAFAAISEGSVDLGLIPIENSIHGRITDIHHLLPDAPIYILGEHFHRVRHQLMAAPGATLSSIKTVVSQEPALGQCRNIIRDMGLKRQLWADTAGAARHVAEVKDKTLAAVASKLAAEIHRLIILKADIEDADHNVTRFLIMSREPERAKNNGQPVITTFIFRVRNVPAALYKALGGFATNGVNLTKLESYQLEGSFNATQFFADVDGHPEERHVQLALEELKFFTSSLKILGAYPAHLHSGGR